MMKPKELKDKIKGVLHLVMTPFDANDELDEKALRKSVQRVVEALKGADAVFLTTGSTGEFYAMSDEECRRVIRIVVEEVNGQFPVLAGTGRGATRKTIEMSQFAQEAGADGLLVVSPYYNPVTEEGLLRHFKMVAENVDVGVMIYNNPLASKLWIPVDLMVRLSKIENIIADKENTANAVAFYAMQKAVDPEDMVITCGVGQQMYPFEALFGCPGFVTEFANFAPVIALDCYRAAQEKNFERLTQLTDKIAPYYQFLGRLARRRSAVPTVLSPYISSNELPLYQSVIKEAMGLTGMPVGKVREPMENITLAEKDELREVLVEMGVL
jgi:4-hydroxy-tetrahydrodipicolinate synthase